MTNKLLYGYLVIGLGELMSILLHWQWLEWVCKPMIIIILAAYYFNHVNRKSEYFSKPVMAALVFSWLGDVALMFQPFVNTLFIVGLGCFLLAHVGYIIAYRQHRVITDAHPLIGIQKFRYAFPIVLAGTGLIVVLYGHLGELRIPVIIYGVVLIVMVLEALFRFGRTSALSFWYVFIGAALFMISDASIAIDKFIGTFELAGVLIMSTYMIAQLLIIRGLVFHVTK